MIIRYYSLWRDVSRDGDIEPSVSDILGAIWEAMTNFERVLSIALVCSLFCACFASIARMQNDIFTPWSYIALTVELVLVAVAYVVLNRGLLLRRSPIISECENSRIRTLIKKLKSEGITTSEQMKIIQNETARLIDRKLYRKETFTARVFQFFVTGLLFGVFTFMLEMVDHGLHLDVAAALGVVVVSITAIAIALSGPLWILYDKADSMPLEQLQDFNNDLVRAIIVVESLESSIGRSYSRQKRPLR